MCEKEREYAREERERRRVKYPCEREKEVCVRERRQWQGSFLCACETSLPTHAIEKEREEGGSGGMGERLDRKRGERERGRRQR